MFHNRLDLAQFEAGFFKQYVEVNRRLAALLQPLLRPDAVIWVHDHHLIPFAVELRRCGVGNPIGFYLHIPFPHWQKFKAFGRLLEKYPQYQREVVLTQIAPPTRESVEAYSDMRHELESRRLYQWALGRDRLGADPLYLWLDTAAQTSDIYRSSQVCM